MSRADLAILGSRIADNVDALERAESHKGNSMFVRTCRNWTPAQAQNIETDIRAAIAMLGSWSMNSAVLPTSVKVELLRAAAGWEVE